MGKKLECFGTRQLAPSFLVAKLRFLLTSFHRNEQNQAIPMLIPSLLILSLSSLSLAIPAPANYLANGGQFALDGVAGALSKVGTSSGGGVGTLTRWDWNDCGE